VFKYISRKTARSVFSGIYSKDKIVKSTKTDHLEPKAINKLTASLLGLLEIKITAVKANK
jgi:hypothetical protein